MPCNCGKNKSSGQYVYVAPNGSTTTYASETQAKAAKIRAGGQGLVRPK